MTPKVACGLKLAKTLKWVLLTLAILAILMSVLFIDEIIFGALNSSALCRDAKALSHGLTGLRSHSPVPPPMASNQVPEPGNSALVPLA